VKKIAPSFIARGGKMKIDLKSYQPKREEVVIPEWSDKPIYVQELLGKHLEQIRKATVYEDGKPVVKNKFSLFISMSVVDENGDFLFSEEDIPSLEKQPLSIVMRIINIINRVSDIYVG
jgi:hypothetical protein